MVYARPLKAAAVTIIATAACHLTMNAGFAWARGQEPDHPDDWAGVLEFGATVLATWILMPLVLGIGMRVLGERRTRLQILLGTLLWTGVSLTYVDDVDRPGGLMPVPVLVSFVLVGALLGAHDPGSARNGNGTAGGCPRTGRSRRPVTGSVRRRRGTCSTRSQPRWAMSALRGRSGGICG
ncbi:hypothetical protein ACGRHY_19405 [Streptomyces sp. HK10]|uniref:hypothetical protein n=1 Tax=Streptomyces sp. HK10 TaxID=3373255 RepID=UPI003747BDB0